MLSLVERGWECARVGHVQGRKIGVRICERVGWIIVEKTSGKILVFFIGKVVGGLMRV